MYREQKGLDFMNQWKQFEDMVKQIMEKEQIPGVAVAVSQDGETIYQQGFGVKDIKTSEPVTPETIFGIASITKSFTALAIMKLAEEGKLAIQDKVINYLPELRFKEQEKTEKMTIHHLLSHTSGLAPLKRKEHLTNFNEHIAYLTEQELQWLGEPGAYLSYSNDSFLLLGTIIEKITGQSYQSYIEELILEPLQMNRTTFHLEQLQQWSNVSTPYVIQNGELEVCPWPTLGNYAVGGGIRSNVLDLLKYGNSYIKPHERNIVKADTVAQMYRPVHQISRNAFYGYGLQTTPSYAGVSLVEHSGNQPGVSSHFGFVPQKGLAAAVLTNVTGVRAHAIWLAAINTALGLPLEQQRSIEPTYEATAEQLQHLAGTYRSAERGDMHIFLEGKSLKATIENKTFTLRASDERTLVIEQLQKSIRFFFKDGNTPWAAFYGLRMLLR